MKYKTMLIAALLSLVGIPSHACVECMIDQVGYDLFLPHFSHCSMGDAILVSKKDHYQLEISTPRFEKSDIKVSTEAGILTIKGERQKKTKQADETILFGNQNHSFIYKFPLGQDVIEQSVKATLKEGMLYVTVQKDPKKAEKIIKVQ